MDPNIMPMVPNKQPFLGKLCAVGVSEDELKYMLCLISGLSTTDADRPSAWNRQ